MTLEERARTYLLRFASEGPHGWIEREFPALVKVLEAVAQESRAATIGELAAAAIPIPALPKLNGIGRAELESMVTMYQRIGAQNAAKLRTEASDAGG